MHFTRTATTDGFGRSVQITNGRFVATMMTGLLPVADMVSRIQFLAPFEQALEQTHKPKDRSLYSAGAMFRQRVFAHICGFEDLADHDVITEDEDFLSALGVNDAAGSSTLCRFENSITRHDLDRLNCCFLDALLRANRKHRIFPRAGARKTLVLTTTGMAHRTIGELVNYKAKSWKQERRLIARRQHDARTNQMDLRLIQTNIKHVKKGEDGWYGKYSEYGAAKLYEDLYCGRAADCELNIAEFKTDCFGGRASSTRFCTNGYRMILGMVTLLVLKLARHYLFGVVKESAKKAVRVSIARLRTTVILVTAKWSSTINTVRLTLPSVLQGARELGALFKIPIL